MSTIYHLIDRLERLLNDSWRMPLSPYVVISEDEFLDVIDQMRTTIPEEIKLGEKIQQERERVIAQAEEEGQRIIQLAQEDADRLLEEHQVIRAAQQRADTVLERAQREAEALRSDADEYARGVLVSLDDQLASVDDQIAILITTVRNGLNTLAPPETPEPEEFED